MEACIKKKLGVLDSGIGGLTFVQEMVKQKLGLDLVYVSDTKNVPYGNKSQDFMKMRIEKMLTALLKKNVHAVLMACNTATAETIDEIRKQFDIPIIGIEPYMRHPRMVECAEERKYALILTPATMRTERFKKLQKQNDPNDLIDVYPLETFALEVESLKQKKLSQIEDKLKDELLPLENKGYTHLILGCTHYGIVSDWISSHLNVKIVDPTNHVIEQVVNVMKVDEGYNVNRFDYSENCGVSWKTKSIHEFPFLGQ